MDFLPEGVPSPLHPRPGPRSRAGAAADPLRRGGESAGPLPQRGDRPRAAGGGRGGAERGRGRPAGPGTSNGLWHAVPGTGAGHPHPQLRPAAVPGVQRDPVPGPAHGELHPLRRRRHRRPHPFGRRAARRRGGVRGLRRAVPGPPRGRGLPAGPGKEPRPRRSRPPAARPRLRAGPRPAALRRRQGGPGGGVAGRSRPGQRPLGPGELRHGPRQRRARAGPAAGCPGRGDPRLPAGSSGRSGPDAARPRGPVPGRDRNQPGGAAGARADRRRRGRRRPGRERLQARAAGGGAT